MLAAAGIKDIEDISAADIFRRVSHTEVTSLDEIYSVMPEGCLLYEETVPEDWKKYWNAASAQYWSEAQKERMEQTKQQAKELSLEEEIKREAEKEAVQNGQEIKSPASGLIKWSRF